MTVTGGPPGGRCLFHDAALSTTPRSAWSFSGGLGGLAWLVAGVPSARAEVQCDQPDRRASHPRPDRTADPRPLENRGPAPRPGHHLRRGRLPLRTGNAPRAMATWRNLAVG